jgi:hypothetical protein
MLSYMKMFEIVLCFATAYASNCNDSRTHTFQRRIHAICMRIGILNQVVSDEGSPCLKRAGSITILHET